MAKMIDDNYEKMLKALCEHEYRELQDFRLDINLYTDYYDLLIIAGIDTVEGFENALKFDAKPQGFIIPTHIDDDVAVSEWYNDFTTMREVFLAYVVKKKLNLIWDFEKGGWFNG